VSRESLILHLGRQPDKIDRMINALNRKVAGVKLGSEDKREATNMLTFSWFHGYSLKDVAERLGKRVV